MSFGTSGPGVAIFSFIMAALATSSQKFQLLPVWVLAVSGNKKPLFCKSPKQLTTISLVTEINA